MEIVVKNGKVAFNGDVIGFLNYAMELEHKPSKDEVVAWLIKYLG